MLPRKLIMDYPFFVKECLLIRYPPYSINMSKSAEDICFNINYIKEFGDKSLSFLKEIEALREEKNHISSLFKGSSKEERLLLKEKSDNIKNRLQSLENERQEIEKQISVLEMSIPNIPSKDTVLWEGYSDDDKKWLKCCLNIIHGELYEHNKLLSEITDEAKIMIKRATAKFYNES